jgi:hypothetical protein
MKSSRLNRKEPQMRKATRTICAICLILGIISLLHAVTTSDIETDMVMTGNMEKRDMTSDKEIAEYTIYGAIMSAVGAVGVAITKKEEEK